MQVRSDLIGATPFVFQEVDDSSLLIENFQIEISITITRTRCETLPRAF